MFDLVLGLATLHAAKKLYDAKQAASCVLAVISLVQVGYGTYVGVSIGQWTLHIGGLLGILALGPSWTLPLQVDWTLIGHPLGISIWATITALFALWGCNKVLEGMNPESNQASAFREAQLSVVGWTSISGIRIVCIMAWIAMFSSSY